MLLFWGNWDSPLHSQATAMKSKHAPGASTLPCITQLRSRWWEVTVAEWSGENPLRLSAACFKPTALHFPLSHFFHFLNTQTCIAPQKKKSKWKPSNVRHLKKMERNSHSQLLIAAGEFLDLFFCLSFLSDLTLCSPFAWFSTEQCSACWQLEPSDERGSCHGTGRVWVSPLYCSPAATDPTAAPLLHPVWSSKCCVKSSPWTGVST